MKKHFCYALIALFIGFIYPIDEPVFAKETDQSFSSEAKAAIAIDGETGKIFYEKNSEEPLPIASTTKLVTMYLILEAIDNGELNWNDTVTISDHLDSLSHNLNLSNVFLSAGNSYSVKDLFNATEKVSANAATIALAEKIAGSEKAFIDRMREKLTFWGIEDAYIISTSGINNDDALGQIYPGSKAGEENLMSAKDLSIVAFHLINDFPEILEYTSKSTAMFAEGTEEEALLTSTDRMLDGMDFFKNGVDGLKTGTTTNAGTCFVGTIKKDNRRVITVLLNVEPGDSDSGKRFSETSRLMDYAFNDWEYKVLYPKDTSVSFYDNIIVDNGMTNTVSVKLKESVSLWINKNYANDLTIKFEPNISLTNDKGRLQAPIKKGENVGDIIIEFPNNSLDTVFLAQNKLTISAYANQTIEKKPWYIKTWEATKNFFKNVF